MEAPEDPAKPDAGASHLETGGAWFFFHRFRWQWPLLLPMLAADVAGIVFGWFYYAQVGQFQLRHLDCSGAGQYCQPVWMWPLVADSPNAVLLFFVAILVYRLAGWRHKVLDGLAFALNIYVGLWTTLLFISYADQMLGSTTNQVLFVTHMGMPLQSLTMVYLMRKDRWDWKGAATMLVFLALFVAVDYWGPHIHPAPFLHGGRGDLVLHLPGDAWLAIASPILMAIAAAAWLAVARPWRPKDLVPGPP